MSQGCTYFTMPFASVPKNPTYTVWYATWSTARPNPDADGNPPFVVGFTTGSVPTGATTLGTSIKDPSPPPPPPLPAINPNDYQSTLQSWLALGRNL